MKKHCHSCKCQELKLGPWLPVLLAPRRDGKPGRPRKLIEYQGKLLSTSEWSAILGIAKSAIENRVKRGWPLDLVFKKFKSTGRPRKEMENVA